MRYTAPKINLVFACVVDRDKPVLAAVISSYLAKKDTYLPVFEFPGVTAENQEYDTDVIDPNTLSQLRANRYSTFMNNVLARMKFDGNLILAGLSQEQKSFITRYPAVNYIEIDSIADADFILSSFPEMPTEIIQCRGDDICAGLYVAMKQKQILKINEFAELIVLPELDKCGIVIIENEGYARSITAINYAFSVDAQICIVKELGNNEEYYVQSLLQDWQRGKSGAYEVLQEMVKSRVKDIGFKKYLWATFFTQGLPYSLIIQNEVPCSYVNIHYNPDIFIANTILFERNHYSGGAGVFSPLFFQDEETRFVSGILNYQNYFVKELVGKEATVFNLDMHLKEFPYDIFHICSHGGEIKGNLIAETFIDRYGHQHVIEYESVMSVTPGNKAGYLKLQRKMFYKRADGMPWASPELKEKWSREIYSDMHNAMHISSASAKKILKSNITVTSSCAIECSDNVYQGMMETIASHSSPIIFNNTCSSWFHIAMPFLDAGARGYIGTLWSVPTVDAANYARAFYIGANKGNLIMAMHNARSVLKGDVSENIYVLWGLHFSTLPSLPDKYLVKRHVFMRMIQSFRHWAHSYHQVSKVKTKESIMELMKWIGLQLGSGWTQDEKERYQKEMKESL
ncbi:MAG: hypothetical protein M0Q26_10610 [Chitinophagaceae bacterium]|nr:hypothetical protein [Chitinophagaceae bacterium]